MNSERERYKINEIQKKEKKIKNNINDKMTTTLNLHEIREKLNESKRCDIKLGPDTTWKELEAEKKRIDNDKDIFSKIMEKLHENTKRRKEERQRKIDEFNALSPEEQERIKAQKKAEFLERKKQRQETIANMSEEERNKYFKEKEDEKARRKHLKEVRSKYNVKDLPELKEKYNYTELLKKNVEDAVQNTNMEAIITEINNFERNVKNSIYRVDPFLYIIHSNRIDILEKLSEVNIYPNSRHVLSTMKQKKNDMLLWMFSKKLFPVMSVVFRESERRGNMSMLKLIEKYGYVLTEKDLEFLRTNNMSQVLTWVQGKRK